MFQQLAFAVDVRVHPYRRICSCIETTPKLVPDIAAGLTSSYFRGFPRSPNSGDIVLTLSRRLLELDVNFTGLNCRKACYKPSETILLTPFQTFWVEKMLLG